jgi:hypothetical protein
VERSVRSSPASRVGRRVRQVIGGLALVALLAPLGACDGPATDELGSGPWDLVWFSDSSGWGVAPSWAELIEQDQGIEVEVVNNAIGNLQAVHLLELLQEPKVQQQIRDAEIIVLESGPLQSDLDHNAALLQTCFNPSTTPREAPPPTATEDWEPYRDDLRAIYDLVFELRAGQPTIVRTYDLYGPQLSTWRQAGVDAWCMDDLEGLSEAMRSVAAEYGVPTAPVLDAFNGPEHDQDPHDRGLIASDGTHLSDAGKTLLAETLHTLGYEPVAPPAAD